jgi:hypothetical protein
LPTAQLPAKNHTTLRINAMDLKNVLRKIDTNRDNFVHRAAPISLWFMRTTILAPRCRRVGAVHCIKNDRTTHCPFKGNASCWTIQVGEHSVADAAWSYETPHDESSSVEKYIAFDWQAIDRLYANDTVIVEQPRDEAVAKDNPLVIWPVRDAWMSKSSRDLVMRFSDTMIAAGLLLWRLRLLVRALNRCIAASMFHLVVDQHLTSDRIGRTVTSIMATVLHTGKCALRKRYLRVRLGFFR